MRKFFSILLVTIALMQFCQRSQAASTTDFSPKDAEILNIKRHNLIKRTFTDLRKAVWQDVTFGLCEEFLQNLRKWSNTLNDENFNSSEFQAQIDVVSSHLNKLKSDPGNCETHRHLVENYVKLRELSPETKAEFRELQIGFTTKLEKVIRKERDDLYLKLNEELEVFIAALSDAEKRHARDLIEWYEKFSSEKDILVKQHMAMDFPRLFPKEQLDIDTTCIPSSITDSIN